jgi:hypothetical protein
VAGVLDPPDPERGGAFRVLPYVVDETHASGGRESLRRASR